jgi:peptidoglycan/xylan/chitin deacetylase (PgdA/CDA1 family)
MAQIKYILLFLFPFTLFGQETIKIKRNDTVTYYHSQVFEQGRADRENYVWDTSALSLIARMTALSEPPTATRKVLINDCITDLKAVGLWQKLDALWVTHSHAVGSAKLNWINTSHNLTQGGAGALLFKTDTGFVSDGTAYLRTNYNPTSNGVKYYQDSASFGVKISGTIGTNCPFGYYKASNPSSVISIISSANYNYLNQSTSLNVAPVLGYDCISRLNGSQINIHRNYITSTLSAASTGVTNGELYLLAYNNGGSSVSAKATAIIEMAWIGHGFTQLQFIMFQSIMNKYFNASKLFDKGKVSFVFDEYWAGLMQYAYPEFKRRGVHGNVSIIAGSIPTGSFNWDSVKVLKNNGWTIKGHTYTHPNLTSISAAQLPTEFIRSDSAFMANGLAKPQHETYPGGAYNQQVIDTISNYRLSAVTYGTNEEGFVYKNSNKYALKSYGADNNKKSLADIKSLIDIAEKGKCGLILLAHTVFNNTGADAGIDIDKLKAILDYIETKDIDIINEDELYNLLDP